MPIILTPQSSLTVGNLVLSALKLVGIQEAGESSSPEDIADGVTFLNLLLDEWSVDRTKIYVRTEDIKTLTVGTGQYTIGLGADIDTDRPERIEQAFIRNTFLSPALDYPINEAMTQEEYNAIPIKTIQTIPTRIFYLKQYPVGTIIFDFLPDIAYELHLFSWKSLVRFTDMNQGIMLPPGYEAALTYNLATNFAAAFGKIVSPKVEMMAEKTARLISDANHEIPHSRLPGFISNHDTGGKGSIYNPFMRS